MYSKIMIDGNSIYEIDEECLRQKERKRQEKEQQKREENPKKQKNVRNLTK